MFPLFVLSVFAGVLDMAIRLRSNCWLSTQAGRP
jgi:hypothetical protein